MTIACPPTSCSAGTFGGRASGPGTSSRKTSPRAPRRPDPRRAASLREILTGEAPARRSTRRGTAFGVERVVQPTPRKRASSTARSG
jgi:hypothetical protein